LLPGWSARETALAAYGVTFGHLALVWHGTPPDGHAELAAHAAAELSERMATLDYEIENLSRELTETYEAVHLLCDVTAASARSGSAEELAAAVLVQVWNHVRCRAAALLLEPEPLPRPGEGGSVRVAAALGDVRNLLVGAPLPRRGAVAEWLEARSSQVLDDVQGFRSRHPGDPVAANATRSLLVAPLTAHERTVGAIALFDRAARPRFDSRDKKLVDAVAAHAGAMLVGLRMAELSKELEIGRRIQQSLLPVTLPSVAGLELAGSCCMARAMGGDFFDAVATPAGPLRAVIADVSGHDLGAALFMAAARAQFHAELLGRRPPGAVATRMNSLLHADLSRAGLFVTYFLVSIDPRRGLLQWAAGGHNPPLLLRRGRLGAVLLDATGPPAGVDAEARLEERRRRLRPGDLLLLYTDGISEARSPQGAMFGEERIAAVLLRHRDLPAADIVARLEEEVSAFRGGAAPTDDGAALRKQDEPAAARGPAARSAAAAAGGEGSMPGQRILVVDDEPFILRSLTYVLTREGFEVVEARDGVEALEVARRERPDLVFLDVMMPRKNGFDVLAEMRATPALSRCRVILLTAKGQDSDRELGFKLGCDDYLTKPFSPMRIVELARAVLGQSART
jgi:serine phosphatase RsbU (regulator of sigma subunit)